ncbi:MAG: nicotinamide-nucleotide amidohydrolase family protein [Clostridiales bacterium]|nr:nicotinamide-nucleotide amidohydrolase family protein [Clostridiales bacterium]
MKVGFLSVENRTVDARTAKMALFDGGHSADIFVTVEAAEIDGAVNMLRAACDAIVIDGNTDAFYDAYKDTLSHRPDHFELDGKLHSVAAKVDYKFLTDTFVPLLNKKVKKRYAVMVFKTYGKSVDELKALLKEYMTKKSKVQFGFFEDFLECEVHARCSTGIAKEDMNVISERLVELLRGCTYAYEDISINACVAQLLKAEGLKIKIAESFTGGALGAAFTCQAGASDYLVEDIVTYSVMSKNKRLGVPLATIAEKGVVSGDTAYNMALGLMASGDCDIAIATTGNAGPTVQSGELGLCYVALGITSQKSIAVIKYKFNGDREHNIKSGVKNAMFLLYESLISYRRQKKQMQMTAAAQQSAARPVQPPVQPAQASQPAQPQSASQPVPPMQPQSQGGYVPPIKPSVTPIAPFAPTIVSPNDDTDN